MSGIFELAVSAIVGVLIGGVYFGGLWWTVRRLFSSRHVWSVYFGSLLLRLALVLSTFYLVLAYRGWPSLAACLLGFIAGRVAIFQATRHRQPASPTERPI